MIRTLVVGYGNPDRGDDGVAWHVVNRLRERLGQEPLRDGDTGLEALGQDVDTVLLLQLVPELVDSVVDYDQVIFVDAHVRPDAPALHMEAIEPAYGSAPFTHHMGPDMLLELAKLLHGVEPSGYLVSIRGHDFDFHRELSSLTEAQVEPAVDQLWDLLNSAS